MASNWFLRPLGSAPEMWSLESLPLVARRSRSSAARTGSVNGAMSVRARYRDGSLTWVIPVVLAFWAVPAPAQIVDTTLWVTNGPVSVVVRDGSTIYIGGAFTLVGPATGGGVPLSVATGAIVPQFPKVTGFVHKAVADGSGGWYIGGRFTVVGGLPRANLAHINADGSVAAWDPNANGDIRAMVLSGGTLYVGG